MLDKHTPGPWKVFNASDVFSDGDAPFVQVADCAVHESVLHDERELPANEAAANARLISAAPELLAACELALSVLIQSDDREHFEVGQTIKYALDKVRSND